MKRIIPFLMMLTITIGLSAQDNDERKPITLPGKGNINVETLNKRINTKMDISNLSVCELRVLRNAFAARQGYLFKNSELRMVFNTTSWYDSLAWLRDGGKLPPLKYTPDEQAFMKKLITTDLYLQLFHLYFDTTLRKVEESTLSKVMTDFTQRMYDTMKTRAQSEKNKDVKSAAEWLQTYFAIAYTLISGAVLPPVPEAYKQMAQEELKNCGEAQNSLSEFLEYFEVNFAYSLFRPRGHYTRSEQCQRYFRAMMWLQTVPFGTDIDHQMLRAALLADAISSSAEAKKAYNAVADPITYLEQQTRIRPKFEFTSHNKVNLMPQRYMPDAEVLQEMCDYKNDPTKRDVPSGLDLMAAMGNTAAERILINELKEDKRWEGFVPTLSKMKGVMGKADWNASVATKWMSALHTLNLYDDNRRPYFMKTPQWDKKNLNATLASWAELKHDAILYAKQPFAAECGDGSLPAPTIVGYVEPNVAFWEKAVSLIDETHNVLRRYGLLTEEVEQIGNDTKDEATFFLDISKKELAGKKITDEEYDHIRYIGATFENLSLQMLREPDQYLQGWYDVQGADKSIAVVADVYTANGATNPEKSILYEAVGPAHEIYVVVEVDGHLRLMRGGVFSYREFKRPIDEPRMTDEEWQEKLKSYPNTGKPSWMEEITIPGDKKPADNETVFYGSGC